MPKRGSSPSHRMNGVGEEKYCSHCGQWKSLRFFYYSPSKGRYLHPCKQCRSRREHGDRGWVPFRPSVEAWLRALVNRVGRAEAARLCGWHSSRVTKYLGRDAPRFVQRGTATLVLQAYRDVEASGVVIARNSIKHGNFERGKPVKFVETYQELYNREGDKGTEYKRGRRRADRKTK
jgi:hypothetical protein